MTWLGFRVVPSEIEAGVTFGSGRSDIDPSILSDRIAADNNCRGSPLNTNVIARPLETFACNGYLARKMLRMRWPSPTVKNRLIAGLWMAALITSMAGWLVAIGWMVFLVVRRLAS
jgi:hypothetical protein